jgi:RNase P/RNase MRP subunit p29
MRRRKREGDIGIFTTTAPLFHLGQEISFNLSEFLISLLVPAAVGLPAHVAGAGRRAVGMEGGVVVETDDVRGMSVAKDVAAVSTVVAPEEQTEEGLAGWCVAGEGYLVVLISPS